MAEIDKSMIALCGMNCALCIRYQRLSKKDPERPDCPGCRIQNKSCAFIKKKCISIKKYKKGELNFCYECETFPCEALKKLDETYVKRYDFSMIANHREIEKTGLEKFIKNQEEKYSCPECSNLVCIHEKKCLTCASRMKK
jgi:hypothetical protein